MRGDTVAGKAICSSAKPRQLPRRRGFVLTFPDGTRALWDFNDGGLVDVWVLGEVRTEHATRLPEAIKSSERGFFNDRSMGTAPVGVSLTANRL